MIANDYYKYLGVKYSYNGNSIAEGFDCMNICCAIAKDRGIPMLNVNLTDHSNTTIDTYHYMFNMRNDVKLWELVKPKSNVLVVFKIAGRVGHVGYMLDDLNFIHITQGSRVTVEKITSPQWEKRIVGFYKYIGD